jgi:hypothetical protein
MQKFLVVFLTPVKVIENWMNTDPAERKTMEDKMGADWKAWTEKNAAAIVEAPAGAGKTKEISTNGVMDTKNDIMMYGVFQAESHDAMASLFVGHPHLDIPEATIQVMTINPLTGMGQ